MAIATWLNPTQNLAAAYGEGVYGGGEYSVVETAVETGGLSQTGMDTTLLVVGALILVGAGVSIFLSTLKRRARRT